MLRAFELTDEENEVSIDIDTYMWEMEIRGMEEMRANAAYGLFNGVSTHIIQHLYWKISRRLSTKGPLNIMFSLILLH